MYVFEILSANTAVVFAANLFLLAFYISYYMHNDLYKEEGQLKTSI